MRFKKILPLSLLPLLAVSARAADTTIQIDTTKEGVKIPKELYGVFLEEIGHGVDGGLYSELVQNRAFEDSKPPEGFTYQQNGARGRGAGSGFRGADANGGKWVDPGGYATTFVYQADKDLPFWSLVTTSGAQGAMSLDLNNPMSKESPRSCKLDITDPKERGSVGIANEGFWGIPIVQDESYNLSFWAKPDATFQGRRIMAALQNAQLTNDETVTIATSTITPGWNKYTATLTAKSTDPQAKLLLSTSDKGTIWFDMVSLMPAKTFKSRPNGMRQDIAQLIADMKPGFARFPGGCVVEAATVETTYNWKNTIGALENRTECWNAWDYRRTHGVGMYEYLQFIEDLGATPMYVGFAGQTCIYRQAEVVPMNQMQPYVDNFLDLADYANAPLSNKWGKLRADSGHPQPFNLHIMEIGNENDGQVYTERYALIHQQLKAAHPEIITIADLPLRNQPVEMIDDHHYADPNYFINNANAFDTRSRQQPPLYLGEVAVTSGTTGNAQGAPRGRGNADPAAPIIAARGNLQAALAEGTYLMGAERNADVVKMISYAPLLGNVHGLTELAGAPPPWHAMIYFDSAHAYGTASYYLWKTFGTNRPSVNLQTKIINANAAGSIVGNVGVGTWGTSSEYKDIKIEKDGKTVYSSDFSNPNATQDWKTDGGRWSIVDGAYRQSQNANGFSYVGDESLSDYTLTLKARKLAGGEGFLIIFGHKGADRYWWNIAGWGNTQHAIELNQSSVGNPVQGTVELNRWYDIKIVVAGMHIQCFLDGKLIHDVQAQPPAGPISALAGRDDATGEYILKVINRAPQPTTTTIDLGNAQFQPTAHLTLLTSPNINDNNSLTNPTKVQPIEQDLPNISSKFDHQFPANSLTVIRLKPRN